MTGSRPARGSVDRWRHGRRATRRSGGC